MSEITDKYRAIIKSMHHDIAQLEHKMMEEYMAMDEDKGMVECHGRLGQLTGLVTGAGDTLRTAYYLCR